MRHHPVMTVQEAIGNPEVNGMFPGHEMSDLPVYIVVGVNRSIFNKLLSLVVGLPAVLLRII